jgi:5-enolpyruvylshikimate-3-phosphate synthase
MISVTSISDETQTESKESDIEEDAAQKAAAAAAAAAATNKVDIVHSKKVLDEREKRAIRLAQESLKHLNPKVRYNLLVRRVMSLLFVLLGSDSIQFNLI